ncbi:predicted protein [Naegleria gruberi]|uniref:Predicted protein n=1 Tax=Naegleria gruberi TaxID=5762 RepID=D2V958_NAEGR|nr:uncharacterized protein NAEGRDRAFT_65573 [Naegleria gruberi]EFC46532.1 predicted protein [Naegleria gruberi]|eukprot:XP_002679276.1 predicted protein [Naegleria gruberi strain NEG-M]
MISEDELFEYSISETTGSETYLNKLFDETLSLMMKHSKVYQIATDGSQNYYSFKFQSLGACLLDTYEFTREADPSYKKKATIVSRTKAAIPSTSSNDVVPSEKLQSLEQEKKELNNQLKQTKSDMNKLEREKILLDNQLKQDKSDKEKLAKEKASLEAQLNKVVKSSGEESSKKAEELRSELEKKKQEYDALIEEERAKAIKKQQALENEIKQLKELKTKLEAEVKAINTKKESDDYF